MEYVAPIIMAVVAAMTLLGAGVKFVWNRIIGQRLDRIEEDLKQCHAREEKSIERRVIHLAVIELLWAEMKRLHPESAALERAMKLMADLKAKQID